MKIFLSLPFNGRNKAVIIADIKYMMKTIINTYACCNDLEFVHNFSESDDEETDNDTAMRIRFLGRAISRLADCDAIFFGDGFESARGCRVEQFVAREYCIPQFKIENDAIVKISA